MEIANAHSHVSTLLVLLLVASATAVCVKWVRLPYAVALVIAGLCIGLSNLLPQIHLTPDLVLLIFLPALLFEASWNLDIKALRRDWLSISVLATVGVVTCMFGVAAILHFAGGMNVQTAMLFGAMLSATDPVSVIALFRQMGIEKRLIMIIEGESLFNDGTAVVLFQIVLALILTGSQFSLINTLGSFVLIVLGGAVLGAFIGYVSSRITSAFDDHLLEITLTTVTAYGSYVAAEQLHVSTVISVVAAGIVVGNYGSRTGMSASTRLAVNSFWEYAAFLVNSLLFLLIGLQVRIPLLLQYKEMIGLGVVAAILSRLIVVYGLCPFVSTERLPIPDKWRHLLFWGGLRGALVMALALSLPLDFPEREAIVNMTFGVVLFTLLVPGLTMGPLVRLLGMIPKVEKLIHFQESKALLHILKAELQGLTVLLAEGKVSKKTYESWKSQLEHRISELERESESLELTDASLDELQDRQAKIYLLETRKDNLVKLEKAGMIAPESAHKLSLDIDAEFDAVLAGNNGLSEVHQHLPKQAEPTGDEQSAGNESGA